MNKKIRWITETAVMLALLVTLQTLTKPMGQLVTGSCVNAVLAVSCLLGGLASGLTVSLVSPVLAFLLGITSQFLTVPAIMLGNAVYVVLLFVLTGRDSKTLFRKLIALAAAASAKFAVLYISVVWMVCGVFSEMLLSSGVLKAPMLKALPASFGWPQLVTALIGGAAALLILPLLRKALRR